MNGRGLQPAWSPHPVQALVQRCRGAAFISGWCASCRRLQQHAHLRCTGSPHPTSPPLWARWCTLCVRSCRQPHRLPSKLSLAEPFLSTRSRKSRQASACVTLCLTLPAAGQGRACAQHPRAAHGGATTTPSHYREATGELLGTQYTTAGTPRHPPRQAPTPLAHTTVPCLPTCVTPPAALVSTPWVQWWEDQGTQDS